MGGMVHNEQLGDFLRARRAALTPEAAGLPSGPARRVPGLRREELAALAGVSVDYVLGRRTDVLATNRMARLLLADFDATIVDGPKAGGLYKVRLRTEDRSKAAREALMRRLAERRDVVRAVLPSRE